METSGKAAQALVRLRRVRIGGMLLLSLALSLSLQSCLAWQRVSPRQDREAATFLLGKKPVLTYQTAIAYPPMGIDSAYGRGGFIHPLRTPTGQVLTRIHPEHHYHHYGLWGPWTKVAYAGDTLDFWNIGRGPSWVRCLGIDSISGQKESATIRAILEYLPDRRDTSIVALREWLTITVRAGSERHYVVDYTSTYQVPGPEPFHLLAHRYAGFTWRATPFWNNENSRILTSAGETHATAEGTRCRWVMAQGELPEGRGGMCMLSHPANFNHPTPLRAWPSDSANDSSTCRRRRTATGCSSRDKPIS